MTDRSVGERRDGRRMLRGAAVACACVALGMGSVSSLVGCGGKEEEPEREPPPPPPPPPDPEPARGEPVDAQALRSVMDIDARVALGEGEVMPASEPLARAILSLASSFAVLGDDPMNSGLEAWLDEEGRSVLDAIRSDLFGLEIEQVRVVYLSPEARTLLEPASATVVLAFQIAQPAGGSSSNVLVFEARRGSDGGWEFSPSVSTGEIRPRASAWDRESSLGVFRGEPVDLSAPSLEEFESPGGPGQDGLPGAPGSDGAGGATPGAGGDRDGGRTRDTPAGPVRIPGGSPAGG